MGIILAEMSASFDTFQCTAGFISEIMSDLTDSDRQISVGMSLIRINHHMMRAVHRSEYESFIIYFHGREHVLFVMIPVTGCLIKVHSTDTRCHNMLITQLALLLLDVVLKFLPDSITLWKEHRKTTANKIVYHEQFHVLADLTMVSFLCFLKELYMRFQFFSCRETYAVDSLKHLVLAVTLPVCTGVS